MDCEQAQQWLHAFMDDELPLTESRVLQTHLKSCPECQERALDIQSVKQTLSKQQTPSVSEQFTTEVMEDVRKRSIFGRVNRFVKVAGMAVTLVIGLTLGAVMASDLFYTVEDQPPRSHPALPAVEQRRSLVAYQMNVFPESNDGSMTDRIYRAESSVTRNQD